MPIKFSLSSTEPLSIAADVLVLGVPEGATVKEGSSASSPKQLGPSLAKTLKREEFTGKKDQTSISPTNDARRSRRACVAVGLGNPGPLDRGRRPHLRRQGRALRARRQGRPRSRSSSRARSGRAPSAPRPRASSSARYRFTKYLTGDRVPKVELEQGHARRRRQGHEGGEGRGGRRPADRRGRQHRARPLNEPPNELYPEALADARRRDVQGERPRDQGLRPRRSKRRA